MKILSAARRVRRAVQPSSGLGLVPLGLAARALLDRLDFSQPGTVGVFE